MFYIFLLILTLGLCFLPFFLIKILKNKKIIDNKFSRFIFIINIGLLIYFCLLPITITILYHFEIINSRGDAIISWFITFIIIAIILIINIIFLFYKLTKHFKNKKTFNF